jgi:hypothetical protein
MGFATLEQELRNPVYGANVGACVTNEVAEPPTGATQRTANGTMTFYQATGATEFNDGTRAWVNGPNGVQSRQANQRFCWESANAAGCIAS